MSEEGIDFSCPARPWLDDPETMHLLYDLYAHYRNGFLPVAGGVLDQPAKLMGALAVVAHEVESCAEERRSEQSRRERLRSEVAEARSGG
jgi:hypothetical protein